MTSDYSGPFPAVEWREFGLITVYDYERRKGEFDLALSEILRPFHGTLSGRSTASVNSKSVLNCELYHLKENFDR